MGGSPDPPPRCRCGRGAAKKLQSSSSGTDGCQHGGAVPPTLCQEPAGTAVPPSRVALKRGVRVARLSLGQQWTPQAVYLGAPTPNKGAAPTTSPKKPLPHLGAPRAPATTTSHLHPNLFFRPEAALSGGGDVPSPVPAMGGVARSWGVQLAGPRVLLHPSSGGGTALPAQRMWKRGFGGVHSVLSPGVPGAGGARL